MVIFDRVDLVGKAKRCRELDLVFGLVLTVASLALGRDHDRGGQRPFARDLADIVHDPVLIAEFLRLKLPAALYPQAEGDARVDDSLAMKHVLEVFDRDIDIGEYLAVRTPFDQRAGLLAVGRFHDQFLSLFAANLSFFEMQLILVSVTPYRDVHVFRGILRRTGAEAVQAEGILIVSPVRVLVLAAGIQFTEDQFPVETLFHRVPVYRTSAAEVLYLDRAVLIACQRDRIAVTLTRLVDRVG